MAVKVKIELEKKLAFFQKVGYTPHPGQLKVHASNERFRIIAAASRFGKSTLAAYEVCARAILPEQMIWCVAPTYDLSDKVFRIVYSALIDRLQLPTVEKSYKEKIIRFPWGTEIRGKSAQIPSSLLGEGVDLLVVDEAARIPDKIWFNYLYSRLTDKKGDAFIISSTDGVMGWFVKEFDRGYDPAFAGAYKTWHCPLWENPHYTPEDIADLKKTMPDEMFRQEVCAEFVPAGGLVYKMFDEAKHVSDAASFVPGTPFDVAEDFGTRAPTAALFIQRVGENMYNIFDEYYEKGIDSVQHANNLKRKIDKYLRLARHDYVKIYHDPAGLDESMVTKRIIPYALLMKANNDLNPGVNTLKAAFLDDNNGRRQKILVHPRCVNLLRELRKYHYPEKEGSELPVKMDDHAPDALRYYFHTVSPMSILRVNIEDLGLSGQKRLAVIDSFGKEFDLDGAKKDYACEGMAAAEEYAFEKERFFGTRDA